MSKNYFYAMFGKDYNIGNLSEEIFYVLLKAKRQNKKLILIRKSLIFKDIMLSALKLKQPKSIYGIKSNYMQNNDTTLSKLVALYGGSYVFIAYLFESVRYKFAVILKKIFNIEILKAKFDPLVPALGVEDIFNINRNKSFSFTNEDIKYWEEALSTKFEINFKDNIEKLGKESFKKLGLDKYPWYVCLHIRTPFFHNAESDAFRNSSIANYYDAIKYITSRGGAVVRMGDPISDVKEIEGFINYPNGDEKTEEMDLYLINNCKFYIGTTSGIHDVAMLFGVPVLSVNTTDFVFVKPYKECDSYIYKHIFSKKDNRILTFKELLDEPFFVHSNVAVAMDMKKLHENYKFIENSSEDISIAVKNILNNIDNNTFTRGESQVIFSSHLNDSVLKWIQNESWFKKNTEQAYRVFSKEQYNGSIDKDFCEKYYN